MATPSHMIASDDKSALDQTAARLSMQLSSTTAEVPTTDHSIDPSRVSDKTLSAALQQLSQLSGQQVSTPTQHQAQSTAPGSQEASLVPNTADVAYGVGRALGASSTQQSAQQSAQQQTAQQAVLQEPAAPAALSSCPPGPADGHTDGARLTNPTDIPLPRIDQQLGSTQQQQQQQTQQQQHQVQLQGLLPFPAHLVSEHDADRGPQAHGQDQMLDMVLSQLTSNNHQALLQILGPGVHQQQQQQQGSSLPATQPLPAALLQPQQQQEEGKAPATQLLAESPATGGAAAAAAAAAAGSVRDVPAGGSNGSGRKGSALQQLLAMALDGTQPSSGASDAFPPQPHPPHTQQQQQFGGVYAEAPDMLLQPQAPYTAGRRARSTQQQQQQQHAPAAAEGNTQQQQQLQQQQKVVKKRRARVMTPSGMGMCQDITPGSIKAVPVALRLTKGSSGEYRLRMPTALILSQFALAKMPVTLPLEVFVDGRPVVTPLAPPRKRQRTALNDPSGTRCDRPLVKIVCDCDRYRLSGLASAGLGRYVGYTVTRVASHDGTSITLFLESPREDRFAGLDMAGYGDSLSLAAAAAAATAAAGGGEQQYDVVPGSDVAHRDVFTTLTAAAALTTAAGGADIAALAAAGECVGGGSDQRPDCGVWGGLSSQGLPQAVGVDPGPALLQSLSAQLQEPLQQQQQQQQQQADLLTLRVFEDMQQQILQYKAFFQQLGVQPPVREDKATQWDPLDLELTPAAAAAAAGSIGGGAASVAASTAVGGIAAGCGSGGTAVQQQQGGVGSLPKLVRTDKKDAEGLNTQEATPAAAAAAPASDAHMPAGATAAAIVSPGAPVKLEVLCDQQQQQQHCSLVTSVPAAGPTAATGASAAAAAAAVSAAAAGLASGAGCRPQVQAGAPRVVEADEAADALLMLSR